MTSDLISCIRVPSEKKLSLKGNKILPCKREQNNSGKVGSLEILLFLNKDVNLRWQVRHQRKIP